MTLKERIEKIRADFRSRTDEELVNAVKKAGGWVDEYSEFDRAFFTNVLGRKLDESVAIDLEKSYTDLGKVPYKDPENTGPFSEFLRKAALNKWTSSSQTDERWHERVEVPPSFNEADDYCRAA